MQVSGPSDELELRSHRCHRRNFRGWRSSVGCQRQIDFHGMIADTIAIRAPGAMTGTTAVPRTVRGMSRVMRDQVTGKPGADRTQQSHPHLQDHELGAHTHLGSVYPEHGRSAIRPNH